MQVAVNAIFSLLQWRHRCICLKRLNYGDLIAAAQVTIVPRRHPDGCGGLTPANPLAWQQTSPANWRQTWRCGRRYRAWLKARASTWRLPLFSPAAAVKTSRRPACTAATIPVLPLWTIPACSGLRHLKAAKEKWRRAVSLVFCASNAGKTRRCLYTSPAGKEHPGTTPAFLLS